MKKNIIRLPLTLTFLMVSAFLFRANAQTSSQLEIQKADSFYFAKDWANAKKLYEHSLKDTSRDGFAWNRLGFSYYSTGNMDAAMKSYSRSLQYGHVKLLYASVYSRMARINSAQNKKELALANIDSAVANGYSTYTELDSLGDFNSVRNDSRFKDLRQKSYMLAYPCMGNAQNRQFDFWVGEWDAYVRGTKRFAGHSVIQIVSGGCAILENWTSGSPYYSGKSLNYIDPATKKWRQTWIGSPDVQEFVNGEYKDGAMRFVFEAIDAQGHKQIGRFIFYNEGPDQVRQFNETSNDDGKTWTTGYDFTYIRKKSTAGL
jgi:tetratricopeptide (TPR) repeat protein